MSSSIDIWSAVKANDTVAIHQFAENGGDLNMVSARLHTPLRYAYELEHLESYKTLLREGASPNIVCSDGHVVTHLAATESNSAWLQLALEFGADPNMWNKAEGLMLGTPLKYALVHDHRVRSSSGRIEQVRLLLEYGADLNLPCTKTGKLPIQQACARSEFEIVYLMLESNADFMSPAPYKDDSFIATIVHKTPDLYSFDSKKEEWCGKVRNWFDKKGVNLDDLVWNGEGWEARP